ncbi:MAG: ATP-dependent DNA helicase RecG [Bacteroidetes bacterium]|nr:MAG: ATP-dependent DNA helicase RecG [Bacteroidota bacterium]REK05168.1 MAG: ATP-dependent DNA helicase RecG [Bacteroidota bacterium]REK32573.1 MAG: ATP-dependent DNA helicase RecG [Bacteroidota bacterium]REK48980.1 MAG: ATP-dependent DNA helicase RecG [Bacteroidota bacterium]
MEKEYFDTPIEFLKGVGPQRAELLRKELGIFNFGDLLTYYPFRYVDRTRYYKCSEAHADLPYVQIRGQIKSLAVQGAGRKKILKAVFADETGSVELKWFQGLKWISSSLKLNRDYVLFGKPNEYQGQINVIHPELEDPEDPTRVKESSLQPVYNSTEKLKSKGLDSKGFLRLQRTLIAALPVNLTESLPESFLSEFKVPSRRNALISIHFPENQEELSKAEFRIKFEELFYIQLKLLFLKLIRSEKIKGVDFPKVGDHFNTFYKDHLPFELTEAQKRVIREIRSDFASGKQMNRLLQGDVGSGKTLVALMCMLLAVDNGYQCCLMAPTEILAVQHAETIAGFMKNQEINVALLTGSVKGKARQELLSSLAEGKINILIGTHALIEDDVKFQSLGFIVIDEQHRFGVEQRARLWKKNNIYPHVLVMTATPIPRTLAMTLYGDLDYSVIDELPPGRMPVKTVHRLDSNRLQVWGFVKDEIKKGRQIYIVYPLIDESEKVDLNNLQEGYESICRDFPSPEYRVSIVHGRMKAADKDAEMQRFIQKKTQIMVATSVIEVGVNVPNATVMIVENAERFGLSQLHQLRGRVGRGSDQSYCILMTGNKLGNDARIRIRTLCETNDGFKISEADLELRGPGDTEGTRQSGMLDLKLANISKDQKIVGLAREAAIRILGDDPSLEKSSNRTLRAGLEKILKKSGDWSRIS